MSKIPWIASLPVFLAGCQGTQSAMAAAGRPALQIGHLMLGIVTVCTVIWVAVVITLFLALFRNRNPVVSKGSPADLTLIVSSAVGATALIIAGFTIASFWTTRALRGESDMEIAVRGEQWWWRITYDEGIAGKTFQTANEIHIPVGKTVTLKLESADVIHSFWVPSLAGKQDLVPGRTNTLSIRAERTGIYRGQCAEFCGLQHTHMAMMVVVDDEATYQQWKEGQRAMAVQALDSEVQQGAAVFLSKPCAACHSIRGTAASGTSGPDLTHIGSRQTLAAGLLETTRGSLAAWIADPQNLKPGTNMPMVSLDSDELRQVSAYMESLK